MRVSKTTSADAAETMLTLLRVAATLEFSLEVCALLLVNARSVPIWGREHVLKCS